MFFLLTFESKNMKKKISVIKQIDAEDERDFLVENLFSFDRELIFVKNDYFKSESRF